MFTTQNPQGETVAVLSGKEITVENAIPYAQSLLRQEILDQTKGVDIADDHWVFDEVNTDDGPTLQYARMSAVSHFGLWSFLPVIVAIFLAVANREPLTSLLAGVVVGAFMLGRFDLFGEVFIPSLATPGSASILILTLWLLGGLLGVWSKTNATTAFAQFMTRRFVRGPNSAKLVTWFLGVLFFQGGTVSTMVVGTTVKPIADEQKVSHEELSYVVDSTASPIASIIPFNVWPVYIQSLIFVPGVAFLATEADRFAFFFKSVPLSFYSILAVLGTFLLSIGVTRFSGKRIIAAEERARTTGQLDAPGATPMSAKELNASDVPDGYTPSLFEFVLPLAALIFVAVYTFISLGSPKVNWAFGAALATAFMMALARGLSLSDLIDGIGNGLKGVVFASSVLLFAIVLGDISTEIGTGTYLVDLLGDLIPYWALPVSLLGLTMITAFSTGTSWGTYPIVFPLAMPLAWAISQSQGVANPELYMMICLATVLNGSVYGDQCSPISDTTVLSAMTTGCDLMDHVKSQIVPANYACALAAVLWTIFAVIAGTGIL